VNDINSCLAIRVDENDDTCYEITSTWMITRYYGWISGCTVWMVEIPSEINGVQITSIWSNAFYNKWISSIIIPEWVTTINSSAFYGNQLKTLTLPSTITTIQSSAFYNNILNPVIWYVSSTGWITNDANNTYIKLVTPEMIEALSGCFSFDSEKWEILDYYAWYKQECGENVEIPSEIDGIQVKSIWNNAFKSKWISSIIIPEWVTSIWNWAFYSNKLTELILPSTLTWIWDAAFEYNQIVWELIIPEWVTSIWNYAFEYNNLAAVKLPNSLTSIWYSAFCYQNLNSNTSILAYRENGSWWIQMQNNVCLSFTQTQPDVVRQWCWVFDKAEWNILAYNRWENCGTDVEIPVEINGVKVRSIWDNAFYSKWITSFYLRSHWEYI
jgi:hypothetical protein